MRRVVCRAIVVRDVVIGAVVLGAALSLGACSADPTRGYAFGEAYDESVRTVAVPVFDNITFNTGLAAQLTDAIAKEIQGSTPYRVTIAERADTVLSGVITRAELDTFARRPGLGFVQEQTFTLTVDFAWRDARSGETIVERQDFSAASSFTPARSTDGTDGERPEIGQRAAIQELAEQIVEAMRSKW